MPTQLVAAFRATLEEVTAADVVIHVRDIANPDTVAQKKQVLSVLETLGYWRKGRRCPRFPSSRCGTSGILLEPEQAARLWHAAREAAHEDEVVVPLSALTGEGCEELLAAAGRLLTGDAREHHFTIPAADGQRIAWLHAHGEVLADEDGDSGDLGPQRRISVRLTPREFGRFSQL